MSSKDQIKEFILSDLVKDKNFTELADSDPLIETGIIDSLGIMKLIGFLEDNLNIQVSDKSIRCSQRVWAAKLRTHSNCPLLEPPLMKARKKALRTTQQHE